MIPTFLLQKEQIPNNELPVKNRLSFLDQTVKGISRLITLTMKHWLGAQKKGWFQSIDSRVKVFVLLSFILVVSFTKSPGIQLFLAAILWLFLKFSQLHMYSTYRTIFLVGLIFGVFVFFPASLNLFTRGQSIYTLVSLKREYSWWIYKLPSKIYITDNGLRFVFTMTLKVMNSFTVVLLIVSTTTFEQIAKTLSFFKIPDLFILTITLSYKYIIVLSTTIDDMYKSMKMRWWNRGKIKDAEQIISGRIGYLFRKSLDRYEIVYNSMLARGYNGASNFYHFEKMKRKDYLFLTLYFTLIISIILINILHG